MALELMGEDLLWKKYRGDRMDELVKAKANCLANPEQFLWRTTAGIPELKNIFYYLNTLRYSDRPNYGYIHSQLNQILDRELNKTVTKSLTLVNNVHNMLMLLPPLKVKYQIPESLLASPQEMFCEGRCPVNPLPLMPTLFKNSEQQSEDHRKIPPGSKSFNPLIAPFSSSCFPFEIPISGRRREEYLVTAEKKEEYFKITIDEEYYKKVYGIKFK